MINPDSFPISISCPYKTDEPNEPIELYSGPLLIKHEDQEVNLSGRILFEWLRGPQITFDCVDAHPEGSDEINSDVVAFTFPHLRHPVAIGLHSFRTVRDVDGLRYYYLGRVIDPMYVGAENKCSSLIWHIANFSDTDGTIIRRESGMKSRSWRGRISLNVDDWEVLIDKVENAGEIYAGLKKLGGYGITHVISVRRIDGSEFDEQDVAPIAEDLFYYLSFSRGFWVDTFLTVAKDNDGNQLWQKWEAPRTDRWQVVQGWFDPHKFTMWEEFWPKFRDRMNDELWGPRFKRAIRWYLAANRGETDVEVAIVLAQTAHELLTWTKFVSENKLTSKGFKDLPASDKLRLILLEVRVSLAIPRELKALTAAYEKRKEIDGPQVITEIRNNIVHPSPANIEALSSFTPEALNEAKRLTMWYLELILLFLLGYEGEYGSRLIVPRWLGQTDKLPWSL